MEKKAAYEGLAEWFEYLNDDCGYEKWSQYLISKLKCFPLTTGLDVGCGSGWFTRRSAARDTIWRGWHLSPAMLSRAEALTFEEGLKIRYLQGRRRAFPRPRKVRFHHRHQRLYQLIFPKKNCFRRLKTFVLR